MTSRLDTLLQREFPTIMVPKYEDLTACPTGKTRLLMAKGGLYLETNQAWGRFVCRVWSPPRELTYGPLEEMDGFIEVLEKASGIIHDEVIPEAARYAELHKEWHGLILYDKGDLRFYKPDFESTLVSVDYRLKLPAGSQIAIDIHSHGALPPEFSSVDDRDDAGGVRICVVLGDYKSGRPLERLFSCAVRYVIEGFFFEYSAQMEVAE